MKASGAVPLQRLRPGRSKPGGAVRLFLLLAASLLFLMQTQGQSRAASPARVVIVTDGRVAQYREALNAAKTALQNPPVLELAAADFGAQLQSAAPAVVLAIGQRAIQAVIGSQPQLPVVYCMVPGGAAPTARTVTGVRLEVQPEQQLALLRRVHPDVKRIGVLYDPRSFGSFVAEASKAAGAAGISLVLRPVGDGMAVRTLLGQLIDSVDALWLLPDPGLITADMFNFLLVYTLEHKVALFGFFDSLTRAGALASVSPDYPQIGKLAARLAAEIAAKPAESRLPLPPVQWSPGTLSINANTAQQLGIELSSEAQAKASQVHH